MCAATTESINFYSPSVGKPTNLQNSAVLRMLQEEENRQRNGHLPSTKKVAWPPAREGEDIDEHLLAAARSQTTPGQYRAQSTGKPVEPPPSTITLRQQVPVSQAPPPVFTSQPATATLKGGKHLRGDLKWPPEYVKEKMQEEVRQRMELAKGPMFKPRRVNRDYTGFFAQHALNSTYPGYKIPPGTQFYRPI